MIRNFEINGRYKLFITLKNGQSQTVFFTVIDIDNQNKKILVRFYHNKKYFDHLGGLFYFKQIAHDIHDNS